MPDCKTHVLHIIKLASTLFNYYMDFLNKNQFLAQDNHIDCSYL